MKIILRGIVMARGGAHREGIPTLNIELGIPNTRDQIMLAKARNRSHITSKKRQVRAISAHQYITVAKKFMLPLLARPTQTPVSKKMKEMMIKMEATQMMLQEETGGKGHFITNLLP